MIQTYLFNNRGVKKIESKMAPPCSPGVLIILVHFGVLIIFAYFGVLIILVQLGVFFLHYEFLFIIY